jgi:hypothetical protein
VLWSDLPQKEINFLKFAFPGVEFLKSDIIIKGTLGQRISLNLRLWNPACKLYPNENICLIDCDTILLRPISHFFEDKFDVLFTYREEGYSLNAGVLLIKNNIAVQKFMEEWLERTEAVVGDLHKLRLATILSGAGDQYTLESILRFNTEYYKGLFIGNIRGEKVIFKGVSCRILNNITGSEITSETHIIHYKGENARVHLLYEYPGTTLNLDKSQKYFNRVRSEAKQYFSRNIVLNSCNKYRDKFKTLLSKNEGKLFPVCAICEALQINTIIKFGDEKTRLMYFKNIFQ